MRRPSLLACTATHTLADGEVHLLGAVSTVTGAMTRLEVGGQRLLIDCGIAQGREARSWFLPDAARDVDAVVLTHGHLDHIGGVLALLDAGYQGPLLATQATIEIARISLEDSLRMQRATDRELERFRDRFARQTKAVGYDTPYDALPGVNVALREAGHILGSASVEVRTGKSRLVFSGDLGRPNSPILRDANTQWAPGPDVDLVIMESTYGSRTHQHDHTGVEKTLEQVVNDAVSRRGRVLIPAFAIGRTQVLLWFLNHLSEQHRIPEVPVVLDTPMGTLVTESYQRARKLFDRESLEQIARGDDPLDFESLFVSRRGSDSRRVQEEPGPMIVIAGSGMVTGGRILGHLTAKTGLADETTTVLFVGHQSEGTPGRRIQQNVGRSVWLDGEEVPVRARIETLNGLSAHADRDELLQWLSHLPGVKTCGLHHGEAEAQRALVDYAAVTNGPHLSS